LQLLVTTRKNLIGQLEPLELEVSLRNNTRRQVYVVESNPLADYKIEVRDEQGTRVEPTPEGKDLLFRSQWGGRRLSVMIAPGETKTATFEVNKIYAMTEPGSYTITARTHVFPQVGKPWIELTSNTVRVKVAR